MLPRHWPGNKTAQRSGCLKCTEQKKRGRDYLDARGDDEGGGRDSVLGNPVSNIFSEDSLGSYAYSVIVAAPIFADGSFIEKTFD
jgi:hypothetical protein